MVYARLPKRPGRGVWLDHGRDQYWVPGLGSATSVPADHRSTEA